MTRADAIAFPFLMDQPIARRIGEFGADDAERFTGDEARFVEQTDSLRCGELAGWRQWSDPRAPKNFVCHPVADAGETTLQEQHGFYRRPGMATEERVEEFLIERFGRDIRTAGAPPGRS